MADQPSAHPDSPAGGGGPGFSRSPRRLDNVEPDARNSTRGPRGVQVRANSPTTYQGELLEAKQTLALSSRTASKFVAQLGALAPILVFPLPAATLGRRPGFQATVLDQKYWFAKLYELVTYEELDYSTRTQYPGFSLHFMKVFYGMYYSALQDFLNRRFTKVPTPWVTHFQGPVTEDDEPVEPTSMEAVEYSVRTGATAHIQHDMPLALADAYRTWKTRAKPSFRDLKDDFIGKSEGAFAAAQAHFYIEVNDKIASPFSPEVGQKGAALYQAAFDIQPSLPVMFQWRRDAWRRAAATL